MLISNIIWNRASHFLNLIFSYIYNEYTKSIIIIAPFANINIRVAAPQIIATGTHPPRQSKENKPTEAVLRGSSPNPPTECLAWWLLLCRECNMLRRGVVSPFKEGTAARTMSGITGHDNSTAVPLITNTYHTYFYQ